ncbi:hypothetical protein [Nitratireductor sp. GZWM139]|uniref:hypothetical protein n=1 Tax=Nitratireductor sp. GZWM139 TaxID=2950541 RepID=UPI0024BDB605|nr:hypothetical protein [Nitratireductor sp. GZWM139]MDJ1463430.1 hypothetical protein [Nitratireductor sp. GZWM139]
MGIVLKLTVGRTEPVLRGEDHFWRVIRTLGANNNLFTVSDIAAVSQEPHSGTIASYLRRLHLAGIVVRDGKRRRAEGGKLEHIYRLLNAPTDAPCVDKAGNARPRRTAQQQMWNVMRGPIGRSGFSYCDLVSFGSTDDLPIHSVAAKSYIARLKRAGYLLPVDPGGPGVPAVWRLKPSRNTGPKPPMILRAKMVFDQNRHVLMGDLIAEEDAS